MTIVFLNHQFIPKAEAYLSPDDRGFRFGDGVFETFPIIDGLPYLWEAHLQRLLEGLEALKIHLNCYSEAKPKNLQQHKEILRYAQDDIISALLRLITLNHCTTGIGRILVTRGAGSKGYLPTGNSPTVYMEITDSPPSVASPTPPAAMKLFLSEWRRFPPTSLPTHAKLMQGVNATLARMEAAEHGADEALLLSTDGMIAEAASGNLFWQRNGQLFTPALSTGALAGTMRARLLQLSPEPIAEVSEPLFSLKEADALIMTNAVQGAVPISHIINANLPFPASNALAERCHKWIVADIQQDISAFRRKMIAS